LVGSPAGIAPVVAVGAPSSTLGLLPEPVTLVTVSELPSSGPLQATRPAVISITTSKRIDLVTNIHLIN
jgi:hypothetical protein